MMAHKDAVQNFGSDIKINNVSQPSRNHKVDIKLDGVNKQSNFAQMMQEKDLKPIPGIGQKQIGIDQKKTLFQSSMNEANTKQIQTEKTVSNGNSYIGMLANNIQSMVSGALSVPQPAPRAIPMYAQYGNGRPQHNAFSSRRPQFARSSVVMAATKTD